MWWPWKREEDPELTGQPCHAQACAIQKCLSKNNFDSHKCIDTIQKLLACCQEHQNKPKHCAEMSGLLKEAEAKTVK
ncbi:hypothetical protein KFL_000750230 [Klebsormidium nitens]|uniref:Cx9C motif-containing protein 4 n=1 Tax=Klebsormidium nitens TaxID=105231 RepID=A0A0U9HIW7_KLENI|nr:hypothetical protein KFL_000750230 [Klebsormidium nitens]|eukprot:GAQ81255.1 hypothetical protein KFL_000750230 [Klebsormidium nitens]